MSAGGEAKVWVGTTDSEKLERVVRVRGLVETGDRVEARMCKLRGMVWESMLRASRGPKTSRAWKAGKRRTAMLRGSRRGG